MLTVSNTSSDVSVLYTPTDKIPYLIIGKTMYFIDISDSIATDIINMFGSGKMSNITNIALYQYDIYRDINEYKAGLKKLFEYFIFDNQWFIKNEISVLTPTEEFHNAATEQIVASQRTITVTGKKFPPNDDKFEDMNLLTEPMRSRLMITSETPIITVTLSISLNKTYDDVKDNLDSSKDDKVKGTYHLYQYLHHDLVLFDMGRSVAKFYGTSSTVKDSSTGTISIDIYKITKEEEKYG